MLFIFTHHRQQGSSLTTPQDRALAQAYQLKQGLLRAPVSRPCIWACEHTPVLLRESGYSLQRSQTPSL